MICYHYFNHYLSHYFNLTFSNYDSTTDNSQHFCYNCFLILPFTLIIYYLPKCYGLFHRLGQEVAYFRNLWGHLVNLVIFIEFYALLRNICLENFLEPSSSRFFVDLSLVDRLLMKRDYIIYNSTSIIKYHLMLIRLFYILSHCSAFESDLDLLAS